MMDFLMYAEDKQKKKKIKDSFTQMIKKNKNKIIFSHLLPEVLKEAPETSFFSRNNAPDWHPQASL